MSSGSVVRARRARVRRDVVLPSVVLRAGLVAAVVLGAAAFALGVTVGRWRDAVPSVAQRGGVAVAVPVASAAPAASATSAPAPTPAPTSDPHPAPAAAPIDRAEQAPTPTNRAERAPVPPAPSVTVRTRAPSSGYGLQVGAFERASEAQAFVDAHADQLADLPVFVVSTRIEGRGTWYRVRLGEARTRSAAEALREQLPPALAERSIVVSHK